VIGQNCSIFHESSRGGLKSNIIEFKNVEIDADEKSPKDEAIKE
jgi:hypothetical protein